MIDERAVVDASAKLGKDVSIGAYSVIGPDAAIGDGTWIGPHVVIKGPSRIGKRNKIYQFASLGEIPQDKKYGGEATELVVGDDNSIREYCTISRGTVQGGGVTRVGDGNWIMAYVHIAHDCIIGNDIVFANGATLAGHVQIDDHAVLGGFTLVHQFCRIGTHAFCGMGTLLNRDLAPYVAAAGNYAKTHGINKEGLRRHGFSADTIQALHRAYIALIRSKSGRDEARQAALEMAEEFPEVRRMLEFVDASERGIVR